MNRQARRRAERDERLSEGDREILRRVTRGDLQPEFQVALDADMAADPLLGGHDDQPDQL